ncbi:hypothetical protein GINT2_001217 [Glugoides intestinalis]
MAALRKQPVKSSENQNITNEEKDLIRIFRENYKSILRFLYSYKKYKKHYKPAFDEPDANKDKAYIMFHKSSEYIKDQFALKYMKVLLQIVVLDVPRNIDLDIIRLMKNIRELDINNIKELEKISDLLFDDLTNLESLSLVNNNIKELQPNIFEKLQKLKSLWLYDNKLTEFPEGILSELGSLQTLDLSKNEIKSFPIGSFTDLTNLKILFLSNNKLTEIPPSILSLTNLEALGIASNNLTSVPKEIGNMSRLRDLYLDCNSITEIPPSILSLTNLQILSIASNNLISVPKEIGNMSNLSYLRLNSNSITEIPSKVKSLKRLYILDLKENPLVESGPQGFMGKRELIEHIHDRFVFETEKKMATYRLLKEELYARLDKEPIHWNRERLKELRLSPVPTRTLSDEDILKIWTIDLRQYCNDTYENETNLIKNIDSYLNVLFTREEIPDGLQREYSIIKDLFEYIFKTLKEMIETDSNGVRSYVTVLAHRMCFCPTGKIEGLEHMYSIYQAAYSIITL